ncbi:hypothetical protein [Mesorhizobium australicum]|uniref:hypothetical protein n=1 Tax=Mesorhizobium australicum TaxID=536018 RepID=UPI00333B35F0
MPVPEGGEIAIDFGQCALDPGAMVAAARAVGSDDSMRVAPVGVVDPRDGKGEARKGLVEGRGKLGVGRLRLQSCEHGFDGSGVGQADGFLLGHAGCFSIGLLARKGRPERRPYDAGGHLGGDFG